MSEPVSPTPARSAGVLKTLLATFVILIVLSLFIDILGGVIQAAGHVLLGWLFFSRRVLPQVQVNWGGVWMAAACLVGVLVLTQTLARWLISSWRPRYTLISVAIVLLMFIAGTAATGIAHQTAWLANSDQPMFVYGGRSRETANRIKCRSNVGELAKAARIHAQEHAGRFPDTLGQLVQDDEWNSLYVCPSGTCESIPRETPLAEKARLIDAGQTSYGYLGRGLTLPLPDDTPIIVEPAVNHAGEGLNIGFADGTAEWYPADRAAAVLGRYARPTTRPAP